MVVIKAKKEHKIFTDIVDMLNAGDCLVLNNTRVIPARLIGKTKKTGSEIELLLLRMLDGGEWETLVRPGKPSTRFLKTL